MKRKLFLGAAFYLAGLGLAQAGDLPPVSDSDWTGLYATLSAGYSSVTLDSEQESLSIPGGFDFFSDEDRSDGAIGGIGAGLNYDMGGFVLGLEGDISLLSNENELDLKNTMEADYDWFATGRLRGGIDLDGSLLYATGGVAALAANFDDGDGDQSETFVGWTAGLGFEQMISESWTWRIEALYADLGSVDFDGTTSGTIPEPFTATTHTDVDADMFVIRAGISLRL